MKLMGILDGFQLSPKWSPAGLECVIFCQGLWSALLMARQLPCDTFWREYGRSRCWNSVFGMGATRFSWGGRVARDRQHPVLWAGGWVHVAPLRTYWPNREQSS